MYIDLIVLVILLIIVLVVFRRFSSFVYAMAIIDIFLRIMNFLKINIPLKDIGKILPDNVPAIFGKYLKGDFYTILVWIYVFLYACFLFYTIEYFIRKKK